MVKKDQGQNDYFNQQSILLTLPAYISATDYQRTYVGWYFNHCHSYIAVHFLETFFITCSYTSTCMCVLISNVYTFSLYFKPYCSPNIVDLNKYAFGRVYTILWVSHE